MHVFQRILGLCCFSISVRIIILNIERIILHWVRKLRWPILIVEKMFIAFLISFRIIEIFDYMCNMWCQIIYIPWFNKFYINMLTIQRGRKKESRVCHACSYPNACYIFTTHDINSNATSNGEHYFPIDQNQNVRFFYTWSHEKIVENKYKEMILI